MTELWIYLCQILAKIKQKFIWEQFMDKKGAQEKAYNMKTAKHIS